MIDNLISDPMKQIWINLELYFLIFSDFFGIFMNLFELKINLLNLKSLL